LVDGDTIRYDSGYLTCSKKLTGSQLSLPHDVFECLREVVPFNVIVVTLHECCAPQTKLSVDLVRL